MPPQLVRTAALRLYRQRCGFLHQPEQPMTCTLIYATAPCTLHCWPAAGSAAPPEHAAACCSTFHLSPACMRKRGSVAAPPAQTGSGQRKPSLGLSQVQNHQGHRARALHDVAWCGMAAAGSLERQPAAKPHCWHARLLAAIGAGAATTPACCMPLTLELPGCATEGSAQRHQDC